MGAKTARVQIIIPVYNAEAYLDRCLKSVERQSFGDWEALLIDDASTDGSARILQDFAAREPRFRCLRQPQNAGVSRARNRGLGVLSAEYVTFLDADDYWEPDLLECMVRAADETRSDIVQCRYQYDFPGGRTVLPTGLFREDTVLEGRALRQLYLKIMTGIRVNHVCMKLIRTRLIGTTRFDPTLKTAEDLALTIALLEKAERFCFLNQPLYHYCRNESSLTGKGLSVQEKLAANRAVSRRLLAALPAWGMDHLFYRGLALARPYLISVSKLYRVLEEKTMTAGGTQSAESEQHR